MKILVAGSCLSALIAKELGKRKHQLLDALHHVRLDAYMWYLSGEMPVGATEKQLLIIEEKAGEACVSQKKKELLAARLKNQTEKKLSNFTSLLKNADWLILDNHYDLSLPLHRIYADEKYCFLNVGEQAIAGESVGFFDLSRAAEIYAKLVYWIRLKNPQIKIIYINYPVSAWEKLRVDNYRLSRAQELKRIFEDAESQIPGLKVVPFIDVPDERLDLEKGVHYFDAEFYSLLADVVEFLANNDDFSFLCGHGNFGFHDLKKMISSSHGGENNHVNSTRVGELSHPYSNMPRRQYWKPSVAEPYPLAITDLYRKKFTISVQDAIATCGSCFAQHIGKRLRNGGYRYLDLEPAPKELGAEKAKALGYGLYSARYGNVYTSRQLVQLFQRAFDRLHFDEVWQNFQGRYIDPFRPNLCGEGEATAEVVLEAQRQHLKQVRRMFETLDVFVFTMGLTETWIHRDTSAVYPICPGVTAGCFDPHHYAFVNLDYATILDEMETFLAALKEVNSTAKVLLTVSPVPLTATAENRHVLLSTIASKSILRAVADRLYQSHKHVDYFPSYDIIMSPPYRGMFFKNNLRSIHEEGVDYVMSHFFDQHCLHEAEATSAIEQTTVPACTACGAAENAEEDGEAFCDEAFLELERQLDAS